MGFFITSFRDTYEELQDCLKVLDKKGYLSEQDRGYDKKLIELCREVVRKHG